MKAQIIILGLSLLGASAVLAGNVVDFSNPTVDFSNGTDWTLGYEFHVTSPITIDALSIYDDGKNGLSDSHAAGLWLADGTPVVSTVIAGGTAAPLDGFFRLGSIAPMTLAVGDYVVGARTGSDNYTWNPSDFSVAPGVSYLESRYVDSGTLDFANSTYQDQGYFGGNVHISASAPDAGSTFGGNVQGSTNVPDAGSTWALFSGSFLAMAALRRKLR